MATKRRSVWVVEFRPKGCGDKSWEAMSEGVFTFHDAAVGYQDKMERRYSPGTEFRVVRYDARK
jgi:hypothetical protein